MARRRNCDGPKRAAPAPGDMGHDFRAACPVCGRRVPVTATGRYARHVRPEPRVGRPPLPPGEAKHARLGIRLLPAELARLRRAADRATEGDVSAFVRDAALVRAAEELGEGPVEALSERPKLSARTP